MTLPVAGVRHDTTVTQRHAAAVAEGMTQKCDRGVTAKSARLPDFRWMKSGSLAVFLEVGVNSCYIEGEANIVEQLLFLASNAVAFQTITLMSNTIRTNPTQEVLARKRVTVPDGALRIESYAKLEEFAAKFADGHFNLLILVGGAGTAKSQTVRNVMGDAALWVEGSATAYGMYQALYEHRNKPVVIDDVDALYRNKAAVRLLKTLCQTDPTKTLSWIAGNLAKQRKKGIPTSFETSSRVVIIANDWKTLNANVYAVQNRGHLLFFDPSPSEIHAKVGEWFWDDEIYEWIGQNLTLLPALSMRHYIRAGELKQAGMDWHDVFVADGISERTLLALKIKNDPQYKTQEERAKAFAQLGGGNRSTYFNHAKILSKADEPMDTPLKNPRKAAPQVQSKQDKIIIEQSPEVAKSASTEVKTTPPAKRGVGRLARKLLNLIQALRPWKRS